jgi:hypothetical protein
VVIGHCLSVILVLISIIPNNHHPASLDFFARSNIVSTFNNNILRSPNSSNAHDLINHSTDFLFTIDAHLLIKSSSVAYDQLLSLSFCITSHISNPNHFIQKNHNLTSFPNAAT